MSQDMMDNEIEIQVGADTKVSHDSIKDTVVIPILNSPIFPGMIAPIILSEDKYLPQLDSYILKSGHLALNLIKFKESLPSKDGKKKVEIEEDIEDGEISGNDVYKVGVVCKIVKKIKLPDGSVNLLVHGLKRYRATKLVQEDSLLMAKTELFDDVIEADEELDAYTRSVINQVKKLSEINPYFNEEMKLAMLNSPSPGALADLVAFSLSLDIPEAQDFLETLVVKKRFAKLLVYLKREKDVADIQKKITDEVNDKVNKYQREYFLREQLKIIRQELGMEEDDKSRDVKKIKELLAKSGMSDEVKKVALEELEKFETIPDSSPEYNVTRTYLNLLVALPWNKSTEDEIKIDAAKIILNKDHYGLEKAKERVLEFLAVRKLKPQYDGTILCFSGPPGVGKTSLGKSIAKALGRKFYRFSLGGMRDEAEIKGHRRTYVGAMPGKIIQAIKRVEVNNPVIMLDEIDKVGQSYHGDPASSLLEVLDPEQNKNFIDNYLDVPFDLSKVLFIATANYLAEIPEPLLDRMEVIELSGYTIEEKISIGHKWVIPKQLKKHGLAVKDFAIRTPVLKKLIFDYAREPGVRMMEQYIARLCRKAALLKISKPKSNNFKFSPNEKELAEILGVPRFQSEVADKLLDPGIVIGLAWTSFGGEILIIETIPLKGKGFKLTGQLGEVMNESANLAFSYVRSLLQKEEDEQDKKDRELEKIKLAKQKAKMIGKKKATTKKEEDNKQNSNGKNLEQTGRNRGDGEGVVDEDAPSDFLANHDIHLHLPAGATPKDGPSAGITIALALYSLAHNKRVKVNLAMTGELSLTGKVLPVGGIKEKVLAAKRAGIKSIIVPHDNVKDLKEVPERHRKGLKFFPVKHFREVLGIALNK
jgi:ATP-dependent Lon protease